MVSYRIVSTQFLQENNFLEKPQFWTYLAAKLPVGNSILQNIDYSHRMRKYFFAEKFVT